MSLDIFVNFLDISKMRKMPKYRVFWIFWTKTAKPLVLDQFGFHQSADQGLKYLGYGGYIYAHSPLGGSQLSHKQMETILL